MKSIVRRDTGEDWQDYLRRLMQAEGIENPTLEEMQRFDRKRKGKKVSNEDWESPVDPDARITRMKDGRTHLAYKAEHVIDLDTELILAATVRGADEADSQTLVDSVMEAQTHLNEAELDVTIEEVVADKRYHATDQLELAASVGARTYIPEPKSPHKRKLKKLTKKKRQALLNNRKRSKRAKAKRLHRRRSERVERSFAHICDTGGARRTWLRGTGKVQKRYLLTAAASNLGLIMRKLFGAGEAKAWAALLAVFTLLQTTWLHITRPCRRQIAFRSPLADRRRIGPVIRTWLRHKRFSTGC